MYKAVGRAYKAAALVIATCRSIVQRHVDCTAMQKNELVVMGQLKGNVVEHSDDKAKG